MTKLLIDETPLQVCPTLATWLGLNEAIFIQQLHYILKQTVRNPDNKVGKIIDGMEWYRDKPRDFMVQYFPFWDENVVKRTIKNLRNDGLLLTRSDLNKIPKDRSLWYTIDYAAMDRLVGPVKRLEEKTAKRRAARKVRAEKEQPIDSNEYTKVQNVLLTNNGTEVQNVEVESHTKCTSDLGTKCTLTEVQNVPIPKESQPLDSKPKDNLDNSNELSNGKPPPVFQSPGDYSVSQIKRHKYTESQYKQLLEAEQLGKGRKGVIEWVKSKLASGPVNNHPAFQEFVKRAETHSITNDWRKKINEKVGTDPSRVARWGEVVTDWCGISPNRVAVQKMLSYFDRDILPSEDSPWDKKTKSAAPDLQPIPVVDDVPEIEPSDDYTEKLRAGLPQFAKNVTKAWLNGQFVVSVTKPTFDRWSAREAERDRFINGVRAIFPRQTASGVRLELAT